ncbi:MAG: hypothetical protein JWR26_5037, partial [Pedosphaera sp.]|nr:hypothetical protein [Pedosphaera sp.]
ADFWFYVAAAGDGRAPLQRRACGHSLHAYGSRGAIPGGERDTGSPLQWEQGKRTPKMGHLFRKRVRIIRLPPASTGFHRLPPASVGLGGGLIFFTGFLADGDWERGQVDRIDEGERQVAGRRAGLQGRSNCWIYPAHQPSLPCLALPCPALPCLARPCPALPGVSRIFLVCMFYSGVLGWMGGAHE